MVTLLETGLFELVSLFFGFLFLFAIIYGLLDKTAFFGDKKGLYAIIALFFSLIVLASGPVSQLIIFMVPWVFVMVFASFFILFTLMIFGLKLDDVNPTDTTIYTWVVIIVVVVLIFGLGNVFGQDTLEATNNGDQNQESTQEEDQFESNEEDAENGVATEDFSTNVISTIVNPNVLGLIALMLVALFSVLLLARGGNS